MSIFGLSISGLHLINPTSYPTLYSIQRHHLNIKGYFARFAPFYFPVAPLNLQFLHFHWPSPPVINPNYKILGHMEAMMTPQHKLNTNGTPSFEDLPLRKGDPHHSAWGLYGEKDELGALNRLTGERVVSAAREEVRNGTRYVNVLTFDFHCF